MLKKSLYICLLVCLIVLLGACQSNTDNGKNNNNNENASVNETNDKNSDEKETKQAFPVTVSAGGEDVTIEKRPEKMMPLSLEVAEIILDLVEPDNVVATTRGIDDNLLSSKSTIAASIDGRIQAASNIDPEEIISYDTDLLVMTKMYGQEEDARKMLDKLDVPILAFDAFVTWDDFINAYEIIGEAIGEKQQAEENIANMQAEIASIQESIPEEEEEKPTVLVLSEVGGDMGPLMMGPTNISYDLIQLAGATPAVDAIELTRSTPASMEQIIKMDPDYILFVDFFGKGEAGFADLMDDSAWGTLTAVQEEQTKILDAKYVINPNHELIEGLRMIVDWLYAN